MQNLHKQPAGVSREVNRRLYREDCCRRKQFWVRIPSSCVFEKAFSLERIWRGLTLGRDHGVWVDGRARKRAEDKQRRMSTDVSMREIKTDTDRFLQQASANMRVESRGRDYKMVEVPLHHDLMMKDNPCCKMFTRTSELCARRSTSLMNSSWLIAQDMRKFSFWKLALSSELRCLTNIKSLSCRQI